MNLKPLILGFCFWCGACSVSFKAHRKTVLEKDEFVTSIQIGCSDYLDKVRLQQATEVLRKCVFTRENIQVPNGAIAYIKPADYAGLFLIRGSSGATKKLYFGANRERDLRNLRYLNGASVNLNEFLIPRNAQ